MFRYYFLSYSYCEQYFNYLIIWNICFICTPFHPQIKKVELQIKKPEVQIKKNNFKLKKQLQI